MELALPREGADVQFGRGIKRLRVKDGLPKGTANNNPILDTRMHEVEFQDRHRASMAANAIAENLLSQINGEGNQHVLFDEVADHRTNGKQVTQQDAFVVTRTGLADAGEQQSDGNFWSNGKMDHHLGRLEGYERGSCKHPNTLSSPG